MAKRIGAFALALVILFCLFSVPISQPAHAVAGTIIVGAVIATMAMAGITFVASGMTAAQLQGWVSDKLDEWAADVGSPLDHLINSAGIGVTISGLLTLGTAAAQGISDFITWLQDDLSLQSNTSTSIISSSGLELNDYFTNDNPAIVNGNTITASNNKTVKLYPMNTGHYSFHVDFQFNAQGNTGIIFNCGSENVTYSNLINCTLGNYNGIKYVQNEGTGSFDIDCDVLNISNYAGYFSYAFYWSAQVTTFTISNLIIDNITQGNNESLSLDTETITIPQVTGEDKIFLDVGAVPGSTVTEVSDGIITDALEGELEVSGEVAEEEPEYVLDGPVAISGLEQVFPFCIPFDLYAFLNVLAADPVAPHFEWRLYVEDLVDYTFVIDLSDFNTAAQILRQMLLLLFCVGLAAVTRELIRS